MSGVVPKPPLDMENEKMSDMITEVWLLIPDRGYEGLGAPYMAFLSEEHAKIAQYMMGKDLAASSTIIVKCPVWKSS